VDQIPQRLPLLHEADWALENELVDPGTVEAKVEICFVTWVLSQNGQDTSPIALELRTSSSKGVPHSWHTNSKIGINFSFKERTGEFDSPRFLIFNAIHQT
jgi:hypothetical protein